MSKPDKKKGYAFVSNEWIFDDRIKTELRLLIYISSLTAKDGYCYASNEHLAKEFKTTTVTISRQINKLIDLGYLDAEYERYGSVIQKRYLRLTKMLTDHYQKCKPTVNKNVKDNNTSINTTSIIKNQKQKVSQPEDQTDLENNETLLKEVEKVMLPKTHYLDLYNRASRAFKKQKSNIKRLNLGNETYDNFNEIYKTYTVGELKTALKGLMIQKNALNSIFTPHHLLKDNMFETYLNAGQNAIRTLYSQSHDKDTKKGML